MSAAYRPSTPLGQAINWVEETLIALLLGAMTAITFANVVARYVFNSNILWALEATVFLFAWLVLLGATYCVKITAHLGVDVLVNRFSAPGRLALAWIALACCLAFSILLFVGCWNYWAPFANLPEFDGTWRDQVWYEVNDIPLPEVLRFLEDAVNQGEEYEKLPRFIPYSILPLASLILLLRFVEVGWRLATGRQKMLIVSHEVEDDLRDIAGAEGSAPAELR
ncbi:MAG: TRAP transporter small permease [Pseudomonadota bacterium]